MKLKLENKLALEVYAEIIITQIWHLLNLEKVNELLDELQLIADEIGRRS